jgi:outer membrane protein OmpA-like peptidoglycan-associated protein
MCKGRLILMLIVVLGLAPAFVTGCTKAVGPDLTAAQEAIAAAKAEGAPDLCPDEYGNAELKLKQAKLLYDDKSYDAGAQASDEAILLGTQALDCALLAKQPSGTSPSGIPKELYEFKESVYFGFNDNTLSPAEANKLSAAAQMIQKYQADYKYYIVIRAYTDLPGTPDDNRRISEFRAQVVRYVLMQNGVDASRIYMVPLGEIPALTKSLAQQTTKKKANKKDQDMRRADILVVQDKPAASWSFPYMTK